MLLVERGKLIIGRLVDDHMIFDPAHLALAGLGLEEAASVLDDLERLSIADQSDPIRYSRHPISQIRLLGNHVHHLRLEMLAQTGATTQRSHQSNAECGAEESVRASSAEERQSSKHMRGAVSLSALDHRVRRKIQRTVFLCSPRAIVQRNGAGVVLTPEMFSPRDPEHGGLQLSLYRSALVTKISFSPADTKAQTRRVGCSC